MISSKQLRRSQLLAALAVLAALLSMTGATFAWYVYNTTAHATEVKMAAGSSISLQIADKVDGDYKSSADMKPFTGGTLNPVSTDKISGGFQRAEGFEDHVSNGTSRLVASLFGTGVEWEDYYKTSLFLRTSSPKLDIYLSGIGFNRDENNQAPPLTTALRLGLVIKQAGEDGSYPEYIFEVNSEPAAFRNESDNADRFPGDDHVLDSTKTDGSTVTFTPLNQDNFCDYDTQTGAVTLKDDSRKLMTLSGGESGTYGQPVEVEVYLWLEGCDRDCTTVLSGQMLDRLTVSFAGVAPKGDAGE